MTPGGWIIMLLSVGGTTVFFLSCIRRVLHSSDKSDKIHGILDTDEAARQIGVSPQTVIRRCAEWP